MIEISFGKLLLLALVALIVLGPEKLPGVARTAGALLRRVRGSWESVRAEVERELQIEEIRRAARDAAAHAEKAQAELDTAVREVRAVGSSLNETIRAETTSAESAPPESPQGLPESATDALSAPTAKTAWPHEQALPREPDPAREVEQLPATPTVETPPQRKARHGDL